MYKNYRYNHFLRVIGALLIFVIDLAPILVLAQTGPQTAQAVSIGTTADHVWLGDIANAVDGNDNTFATCQNILSFQNSDYLNFTEFGFDIDDTHEVDGIVIEVRGKGTGWILHYRSLLLIVGGSYNAVDHGTTTMGINTVTQSFGGSSDTWGGVTRAQLEDNTNFGVAIQCGKLNNSNGDPMEAQVIWVRMTVYHSVPPFGNIFTASTTGDWDDGATWGNGAGGVEGTEWPGINDAAYINGGVTVTVPTGLSLNADRLELNQDLNTTTPATLNLNDPSSSLTIQNNVTFSVPGTHTVNAANTINMNGGTMNVNGSLFLNARRIPGPVVIWESNLDVGGGTLNVLGDIVLSSDHVDSDTELDISTNESELILSGGFIEAGAAGTGQRLITGSDCTVEYNLAGAQTIEGQLGNTVFNYDKLSLSNDGVKTMGDDITVNGTLLLDDAATFANGGNTLTYGATSILEYSGSGDQTAGDEMSAVGNVQTLIVNNGNTLNLSADETVDDAITLTNGTITLGTNDLILSAGGALTGSNTSNYVVTNSTGYYEETTAGATVYPVGTSSVYNPATITPASDAAFQVSVGAGPNNSPNDAARAVQLEWQINTGGSPGATTVQFEWDQSQEGVDFQGPDDDLVVIGHYAAGAWAETNASYNEDVGASGRSNASAGGFTSFPTFAVGSESASLPIELKSFRAIHFGTHVRIEWNTYNEINNDFFTIEKSLDKLNWNSISTVTGAGNSSSELTYFDIDHSPSNGLSYYRLIQTDYDGKYEIFDPVRVESEFQNQISVSPNPLVDNQFNIVLNQDLEQTIYIYDSTGKEVDFVSNKSKNGIEILLTQKNAPGLLIVMITSTSGVFQQKILVK